MTKKIFYEKIGRRYVPVSEYDSEYLDSFREGVHLVMSYPGGQSRRFNIDPAFGPMIAAGRFAEDAISKKIMDVSAIRCSKSRKPITERQRAAWEELCNAFGDDRYPLEYCSYRDAAVAGVAAMQQEAEKMLENPAVRKAWDNFMLVWQLTKKEM